MGGSGGGGGGKTTYRYAEYIENKHKAFLEDYAELVREEVKSSPFDDYVEIDTDTAFLGAGVAMSAFPALFSLFLSNVKNLDINQQYTQDFSQVVNSQNVKELVAAEGVILNDDIETNALPRLNAGARDIGAVLSSSFVIARANLEADRVKQLEKFSASLKTQLIPVAVQKWQSSLEWNRGMVHQYAQIMQLYFSGKLDMNNAYYDAQARKYLWPFKVYDYYKAGLGALQGSVTTSSESGSVSTTSKAIGGALSGAAAGAMVGGPWGAAIGGAIGLASSLL